MATKIDAQDEIRKLQAKVTWNDRLQEAYYVTPSGERFPFIYEAVKESFVRKGKAFERAGGNGTYVQGLGNSGRRLPITAIFAGEDCDEQARAFMKALSEPGVGKLEHPRYGTLNVLPLGTVERIDDLVKRVGEVRIKVEFWETVEAFKSPITSAALKLLGQLGFFDEYTATVDEIKDLKDIPVSKLTAVERFLLDTADQIEKYLAPIANVISDTTETLSAVQSRAGNITSRFSSLTNSIKTSIGKLETTVGQIVSQSMRLVLTPANAFAEVRTKFFAYKQLALTQLDRFDAAYGIGDNPGVFHWYNNAEAKANFTSTDHVVMSALAGAATVAGSTTTSNDTISYADGEVQFRTRNDAIQSAEDLLELLDTVTEWREATQEELNIVDTGGLYQLVYNIVVAGAQAYIEEAFSLKQEQIFILDRARTVIDLEYEIYGTVDDNLDFLIATNNLTGSEILELPKGKQIKYYV